MELISKTETNDTNDSLTSEEQARLVDLQGSSRQLASEALVEARGHESVLQPNRSSTGPLVVEASDLVARPDALVVTVPDPAPKLVVSAEDLQPDFVVTSADVQPPKLVITKNDLQM